MTYGTLKTISNERVQAIAEEAQEAFWAVVVKHFPTAKHGDFSPSQTFAFNESCEDAVVGWVLNNVPEERESED